MAQANHETPFNFGVDAALSETSLHKVPNDATKRRTQNGALFEATFEALPVALTHQFFDSTAVVTLSSRDTTQRDAPGARKA